MSKNNNNFKINPDVLNQILPGAFTAVNENWKVYNTGMNWSGLVIVSMLIEYCLKYILQCENKPIPTSGKAGHNVLILFSKISKEKQQKIQTEIDKFTLCFDQSKQKYEKNAEKIIKKYATLFNDWRYAIIDIKQPVNTQNTNFYELRLILMALLNNTDLGLKINLINQEGRYIISYDGGQNVGLVKFR